MLQETKIANKNMEAQLNQTRQQLSKQITEECQAVKLRSGKTLNVSTQSSKKPRKEQLTEDNQTTAQNPSEDSKSPERNTSGVQTPEKGENLALNAHSLPNSGVQTPIRDQTPASADSTPSKKASPTTSVGNKPAATKVEEYKAKMPYPQKLRQAEQDK